MKGDDMATILETITIHTTSCCTCGVVFGMPSEMLAARREDKGEFFCPSGHPMVFRESEADRLRKQVNQLTARVDQEQAEARRQRERVEAKDRQLSAAHGQITKIKNRVGAGVCPCCTRTFCNLARHMQTKHPEYRKEPAA